MSQLSWTTVLISFFRAQKTNAETNTKKINLWKSSKHDQYLTQCPDRIQDDEKRIPRNYYFMSNYMNVV